MNEPSAQDKQRLDRWLWHARIVKTRSLAQKLVTGGKVRINREKVLASSASVRIGDVVTVAVGKRIIVYRILGFAARRGPAVEAQQLYEDLTPREAPDNAGGSNGIAGVRTDDGPSQRPDKRDRRKLMALKKNAPD